jgi:hypothetical protein
MRRSTNFALNIILVVVSTASFLFVADLVLKALKLPSQHRTIMLLAGSKLFSDEHGVRRYEPNKYVEQAALVDGEISYRYKYKTNNLGLGSKYDYVPGKLLDLMIVGDSVSEGQEVGPWLDVVQQKLWERHGKTSQNFAIAGNGFVEFERAAAFAKSKLGASKALIIFIGDDMHRPGDVMHANEDCSTYKTFVNAGMINCLSGQPTWHHYDAKLSDEELVRFAESRQSLGLIRMVRAPIVKGSLSAIRQMCSAGLRLNFDWWFAQRFNHECVTQEAEKALGARTVALSASQTSSSAPRPQSPSAAQSPSPAQPVASAPQPVASSPSTSAPPAVGIPSYTITALEKILRLYGPENVLLVTVPGGGLSLPAMRHEAVFNELLGGKFKSPLQYADLSVSCHMPRELWAPRLGPGPRKGYGHPTAEGYLKLQSCILGSETVMAFSQK